MGEEAEKSLYLWVIPWARSDEVALGVQKILSTMEEDGVILRVLSLGNSSSIGFQDSGGEG